MTTKCAKKSALVPKASIESVITEINKINDKHIRRQLLAMILTGARYNEVLQLGGKGTLECQSAP